MTTVLTAEHECCTDIFDRDCMLHTKGIPFDEGVLENEIVDPLAARIHGDDCSLMRLISPEMHLFQRHVRGTALDADCAGAADIKKTSVKEYRSVDTNEKTIRCGQRQLLDSFGKRSSWRSEAPAKAAPAFSFVVFVCL